MAAMSDAQKRANKKWNDANLKDRYDRIGLLVPKGHKQHIQAAANAAGLSLNGFICEAIDARMERDGVDGQDTPE